MIRFLQTKGQLQKILLVGFLSIICIMMVVTLVPGGLMGDTNDPNVLAKVGSNTISVLEANREADRMIRQQFQGRAVPPGMRQLALPSALNRLVLQGMFQTEAERLGLHVTDEELRYNLEHGPLSQALYPEGKFIGTEGYQNLVRSNWELTVPQFEELVKKELLMQKLRLAVTGGVTVSDSEVRQAFNEVSTKVKFDYAVISLDSVMKEVKPSDAEVRAYFEKNAAQFANYTPETRKIRFMVADSSKLPNPPKASEEELQRYYNAHQQEYKFPESETVRHILIKTESQDQKAVDAAKAKAEDVLKQLRAGGNFAALAKKYSDDPGSKDKGGELGAITRSTGFVKEFMDAAWGARKGETVGPVKSQFGFHIIQVEDRTDAHQKTLAEVRPMIQPLIERDKAQAGLETLSRTLDSEIKTQGMDKVAAAHGLQIFTSAYIKSGDSLPGVGTAPTFMQAMFGEKPGATPLTVVTGPGVVIGQVLEVKPPGPAEFDTVKGQISSYLQRVGAQQAMTKKTQDLLEKARNEHNIRTAAKAVGATVKTSELVEITQQVPDIGQVTNIPNISKMKPGEISGPVTAQMAGIVVALLERQEPTDAEFKLHKEDTRQGLLAQKRDEALQVYAGALRARMEKANKVMIFDKRLKAATGNAGE